MTSTTVDTADLGWLVDPAPDGSPADVPALRRPDLTVSIAGLSPRAVQTPAAPPVLVVGGGGASGTTSVAAGLGAALAVGPDLARPLVVDASPAGGDLAVRSCRRRGTTVQEWLTWENRDWTSTLEAACGTSDTGARVLASDGSRLPGRDSLLSVHRDVDSAGYAAIYDGGSPVSSRSLRPLLSDPEIRVVLCVAARADAVNRLRPVLAWLDREYGPDPEHSADDGSSTGIFADLVIAVCRQNPFEPGVDFAGHIRTWIRDYVRAVIEIPYDQHLGAGGLIEWNRLAEPTRDAYRSIWSALA